MKRTLFAATLAAQVIAFPSITFAAVALAPADTVDAKTQALLQQCLDNKLLLPEQVQTMNDAELNAALVDCAATLQAQTAAAPAPIVRRAPVVVEDEPVVVRRSRGFVAAAEPTFVGGGGDGGTVTPITFNNNSNNNSGNTVGDGSVFGNGNVSGGLGGTVLGGILNGGVGNGGGGGGAGGAGGGGAGGGVAGNGAGGGAGGGNNIKLNNIQKDALIGNGLQSGEAKSSSVAKDIGNGLKSVTDTKVTKLPNGNVRVSQSTSVVSAATGQIVGSPQTKAQTFTPDDINVLKQAHGNAPLDNIPTFAKKGLAANGNGPAGHSSFAAMRARLAGLKDGNTNAAGGNNKFATVKDRLAALRAGKADGATGNNRFAAMRERLASLKTGKTGTDAGHSRFAEMRAKLAAAREGKTGTAAGAKTGLHNRFAEFARKRRQMQTAGVSKGSSNTSSLGKIAKKSDRGIIHTARQNRSAGLKNFSKTFKQHQAASSGAKSSAGKSRGGSVLRRLAHR